MKSLFSHQAHLDELASLAPQVLKPLLKLDPFCLWLEAEMGSGKTTLVRTLMQEIGLSQRTPVQSPTYTIVNEYQVGSDLFAHIDFYRVGDNFSLDELGICGRGYRGLFIEWPEVPAAREAIAPTHLLKISATAEEQVRLFQMFAL